MANIASVLRDEICRLSRKEIRQQMSVTVKASAQHRRDIAEMKRQIQSLRKAVAFLERQEKKRLAGQPAVAKPKGARFSAKGVRTHRERVGLSARNYASLWVCLNRQSTTGKQAVLSRRRNSLLHSSLSAVLASGKQ